MKQFAFPALAIALLLITACKETPVTIPALSVGERKVLVEEITGVNCPNCPDGATELQSLQGIYGENLIVVSIHEAPGVLNDPLPSSQYDFHFQEATELTNYVSLIALAPSAAINRVMLPNDQILYLDRTNWAGVIPQQINQAPKVGVFINSDYSPLNRKLEIEVRITPEEYLPEEHRLSIYITQDSIVDAQAKTGVPIVFDYLHRHVLRQIVTLPSGDVVPEPFNSGDIIIKRYEITLDPAWDENHCSIVAFVHHGGVPDKVVLQADEKHIIE
ncbi:MAG: Omp28-related outer membrane protein [Lewinellaceae bacterium]|nr:Omp28-related outer membrane protein [Lewinellaceae bacterium]